MPLVESDARENHPSLSLLLNQLASNRCVKVSRFPLYPSDLCYWNIADHTRRRGGAILFGWMILEAHHLFLRAWHHAVWVSPEGLLFDLSSHPVTGILPGVTLFAVDPRQAYDISWAPAISMTFEVFRTEPVISDFISCYHHWHSLKADYLEAQRAIPGAKFDASTGMISVPNARLTEIRGLEDDATPEIIRVEEILIEKKKLLSAHQMSYPMAGLISKSRFSMPKSCIYISPNYAASVHGGLYGSLIAVRNETNNFPD